MNRDLRHRIFAIILVVAVCLPFAVQALHTLDDHEHVVCTAKDTKHFHEQEQDCFICCTPLELNTISLHFTDTTFKPNHHTRDFKTCSQLELSAPFKLKSPRAPPYSYLNL